MPPSGRIGTEFAGYRLEGLVGRGGTSIVYRAENVRIGVRVALKILNPELAEDESFRERFVRESRLAASINHPNVITIYDAGVWEDSLYIAMRYVPGDLAARLRTGAIGISRALEIISQVAAGLDAAHACGLIHRDVKPANVMLDPGPGGDATEFAYVTDFGLTKQAHSSVRATESGDFLGTVDYVAPEQIEGRPVDSRADVYSLGCMAYECLTGTPPFRRESDAAVLWAHMQEPPPRVTVVRTELPASVDDVLGRAMAKRPQDRFATCRELADALKARLDRVATRALPSAPTLVTTKKPEIGARPGRLRRLAPFVVGALVGAASASASFLLTRDETATSLPTTLTVTTSVAGEPERLPSYVPEPILERCGRDSPVTPDFDVTVSCRRPAPGVNLVEYSHALSSPLLTEHLYRRVAEAGLATPDPGQRLRASGSCDEQVLPAVEEWTAFGRAGHEAVGETAPGLADGRVLCHVEGKRAWIEWTTSRLGVYASAYGPNYRVLYEWWRTEAGPLK